MHHDTSASQNLAVQWQKIGLGIVKQRRGTALTYTSDMTRCGVDATAGFTTRLNTLRGSTDTLSEWAFAPHMQVSFAVLDAVDPAIQGQNLDGVATDLTSGIDVAGLCGSLNSRGVMRRRAVMDSGAIPEVQRASPLAVTVNDPALFQASLFNIMARLEFNDAVLPALKVEGAELCFWFCTRINIGHDSAQAELLLSQVYIATADFAGARNAIHRAAKTISGERHATDVAFCLYLIANLRLNQARHAGNPPPTITIRARLIRAARI